MVQLSSGWLLRYDRKSFHRTDNTNLWPRELEAGKAKLGEEAEFTGVNEHSEPNFNAA